MADRVLQRRDTAANWSSANPILAEGEIGIVTDTKGYKIGDGSTAWNNLAYPSNPTTISNELGSSSTVAASQSILTESVLNTIQLDDIDLDSGTIAKLMLATVPARYTVMSNNKNCGTLDIIGDNMGHMLTQVFETHYIVTDGELTASHSDDVVYRYTRSYHYTSGGTSTIPVGTWGDWVLIYSSTNNQLIDLLETGVNNLNKNTGISEYETFSDAKAYSAGDTVLYNGLLYTFKIDHAIGAWDETHVESTSLKKELDNNINKIKYGECFFENLSPYKNEKLLLYISKQSTFQQVSLYKNDLELENCLANYYKKNSDNPVNNGIIKISQFNDSGVSGYILVDFSSISIGNKIKINVDYDKITNLSLNPSIENYILQNSTLKGILPCPFLDKGLYGDGIFYALKELYIPQITDEYSTLNLRVTISETANQLTVEKDGEPIMNYYSTDKSTTYGLFKLSEWNSSKLTGYAVVDFSQISVETELYAIKYDVATNINNCPIIKNLFQSEQLDKLSANSATLAQVSNAANKDLFIQPASNTDNLLIRLDKYLMSHTNIKSGEAIRFYDSAKDGDWCMSLFVEVKPNTVYTIGNVNEILEFDASLNYIKSTIKSTYSIQVITTSETTKYITTNIYVTDGNPDETLFKSIQEGTHEALLNKQTILPIVTELNGFERDFKTRLDKWSGKRLLAIGDSITAANLWQKKVGELLGMNVRTHAKGGIGIITMVDGDGSETPPEYDPDDFGVSNIYPLNTADVTDVDVIIIMGFYNARNSAVSNPGNINDMYPSQSSFTGQVNYAIKRIYEELQKANNLKCQVFICSAHKYGKYPWNDLTAYEDGEKIYNATKKAADYNSLYCIDLMNCGGINKYNWNTYQSSNTPYNVNYIPSDGVNNGTNKPFASLGAAPSPVDNTNKYITVTNEDSYLVYKSNGTSWEQQTNYPYPWNADQVHLNTDGYYKIGEYIAALLLSI